jgi:hypothetical protein
MMNSTNTIPDEKNESQEESEVIEQEHEVDAAEDVKPVERTARRGQKDKSNKITSILMKLDHV